MSFSFISAHSCLAETETKSSTSKIILIIDDIGNHLSTGTKAIRLPGNIHFAFLPHTPYARELAEFAHSEGKEILLHAPMSNLSSKRLGDGALIPAMNQEKFLEILKQDLAAIPHAKGLNNHMGSLMTQLRQPMNWLMQELKQQGLYFIDSRTTPLSIAEATAKKHQIPTLKRDVFLDNQRDPDAIKAQFEKLIKIAKNNGLAVAIGHPYPETIRFLQHNIPLLAERNIELVYSSELFSLQKCNQIPTESNNCHYQLALEK